MAETPAIALFLSACYLLGAVPVAYLMARGLKGVDIREHGSRNPGATNVFRVVGKGAGITTFCLDVLKGLLPALAAGWLFPGRLPVALGAGLAAIAGHNWPVFLKFRGGKGVATSAGVFLALAPLPTLLSLAVFGLVLWISGHVSVGSMAAAVVLPVALWFFTSSKLLTGFAAACALLVLVLHRANIGRLIRNEEHKVSGGPNG